MQEVNSTFDEAPSERQRLPSRIHGLPKRRGTGGRALPTKADRRNLRQGVGPKRVEDRSPQEEDGFPP